MKRIEAFFVGGKCTELVWGEGETEAARKAWAQKAIGYPKVDSIVEMPWEVRAEATCAQLSLEADGKTVTIAPPVILPAEPTVEERLAALEVAVADLQKRIGG